MSSSHAANILRSLRCACHPEMRAHMAASWRLSSTCCLHAKTSAVKQALHVDMPDKASCSKHTIIDPRMLECWVHAIVPLLGIWRERLSRLFAISSGLSSYIRQWKSLPFWK